METKSLLRDYAVLLIPPFIRRSILLQIHGESKTQGSKGIPADKAGIGIKIESSSRSRRILVADQEEVLSMNPDRRGDLSSVYRDPRHFGTLSGIIRNKTERLEESWSDSDTDQMQQVRYYFGETEKINSSGAAGNLLMKQKKTYPGNGYYGYKGKHTERIEHTDRTGKIERSSFIHAYTK